MGQEIRESFDGNIVATNGSNNRVSNSNVANAGSRSSKNAIGMSNMSSFDTTNGPTPLAPSKPNGGSSQKNNSSSSKRKTSKKLQNQQPIYNTSTVGPVPTGPQVQQTSTIVNPSSLTGDQLLYMMQNKRDKFNNSALLQGQRSGFDEFNQSLAAQISGQIRPDLKNAS